MNEDWVPKEPEGRKPGEVLADEYSEDEDEPTGYVYSHTEACPACGEVHPC